MSKHKHTFCFFIQYSQHRRIQVSQNGGLVDLPFSLPWHRLLMSNTIPTIISQPIVLLQDNFSSTLVILAANNDSFYNFAPPNSMTCFRLLISNFWNSSLYVKLPSFVYRAPSVASRLVDKHAGAVVRDKKYDICDFVPYYANITLQRILVFFINIDPVEANRMSFEFGKSIG